MKLIDFNDVPKNIRRYGGNAGNKFGVRWNDENWILKFPKSTTLLNRPQVSYTTSPLSEYLGSKIYEVLDFPVHTTFLGYRKSDYSEQNKIVVACKDFRESNEQLIEFKEIKNAQFYSGGTEGTSGAGTNLNEILETIEVSADFEDFRDEVRERFWDMFIVDFFIGNNDRNNTNWGLLATDEKLLGLAPVYDNGNAFFNKRGEAQFGKRLSDVALIQEDAYKTMVCAYTDDEGNFIHPSELISSLAFEDCNSALLRFIEKFDSRRVIKIFEEIPSFENNLIVFPEVQKEFYLALLDRRLKDIIIPAYEKLKLSKKEREAEI